MLKKNENIGKRISEYMETKLKNLKDNRVDFHINRFIRNISEFFEKLYEDKVTYKDFWDRYKLFKDALSSSLYESICKFFDDCEDFLMKLIEKKEV